MNTLAAPPAASVTLRGDPLVAASLAATWLVWGSTYLAIKFALLSFPPFVQMGSRFLVAGALLAAWMRWRGAAWPSARQWLHALAVGALMLGCGMGGTAFAEQTVGSGLVVAFFAVSPLTMVAGRWLAFGERPQRHAWLGLAIGLAGVLLLARGASFAASTSGLVAIVIACFGWTTGSLLSQRRMPLAPGAMGFASEMLAGGAVLMLLSLLRGESVAWPPQPVAVAAWGYLVVFGSLIAFNAYMVLLARTPASIASSYCYVNPVIAMLLGVTLGGEVVSAGEWVAAGVVLAGVLLLFVRRPR